MARRGFLGTLAAMSREMEREARRRARELERQERELRRQLVQQIAHQQKELELALARNEVAGFGARIEQLLSVHRECRAPIDWAAWRAAPAPLPEAVDRLASAGARAALEYFRPTFFQRLFGTAEKARQRLQRGLEEAIEIEARAEESAKIRHAEAMATWKESCEFADRVLQRDQRAFEAAIAESGCLSELAELHSPPVVEWPALDVAQVWISADQDSVVPTEEKKLTARGKLAMKAMPARRRMEIYQDYVCGAALRAARELLAVLPIRAVISHVRTSRLDSATGRYDMRVVVSVYCPRESLANVNWELADASDLVERLAHRMEFKRGEGFSPVEPLDVVEFVRFSAATT